MKVTEKTYITEKVTQLSASLKIALNSKKVKQKWLENHTHHAFKPKYLVDYRVLNILNESTLLLVTLNHKVKWILIM